MSDEDEDGGTGGADEAMHRRWESIALMSEENGLTI